MLTENTKMLKGKKAKVAERKQGNQGNANGELIQKRQRKIQKCSRKVKER